MRRGFVRFNNHTNVSSSSFKNSPKFQGFGLSNAKTGGNVSNPLKEVTRTPRVSQPFEFPKSNPRVSIPTPSSATKPVSKPISKTASKPYVPPPLPHTPKESNPSPPPLKQSVKESTDSKDKWALPPSYITPSKPSIPKKLSSASTKDKIYEGSRRLEALVAQANYKDAERFFKEVLLRISSSSSPFETTASQPFVPPPLSSKSKAPSTSSSIPSPSKTSTNTTTAYKSSTSSPSSTLSSTSSPKEPLIGTESVNTMLRCYLLQKDSNGAEKLFKYIKDTNKKLLKVSSFNLLIEHFAHRGQLEKSIRYFEEMKSMKMTPDRFSFSSILQGISKEGDVHKLLEWIKDIERDGMKMDEQMYRAVVFTLEAKQDALNMDTKLMLKNAKLSLELNSKLGELVESDATPEEAVMMKKGAQQTPETLVLLSKMYQKKLDYESIEKIVDGAVLSRTEKLLDVAVFNILLDTLSQKRLYDKMKHWIVKMKNSYSITPNEESFLPFMNAFRREGKMDALIHCFEEMKKRKLKLTTAFDIIIAAYRDRRNLGEMSKWFDLKLKSGEPLTEVPVLEFMTAHALKGDLTGTLHWFEEYNRNKFPLTTRPYSIIMDCLIRKGKLSEALEYLDKMKTQGIKPDEYAYTPFLKHHMTTRNFLELDKLWKRLKDESITPHAIAYSVMIEGSLKREDEEMALDYLAEMKKMKLNPSVYVYNLFIDYHAKEEDVKKAMYWYKQLEEVNLFPNTTTFNALMNGYGKRGELDSMMSWMKEMESRGLKPNTSTYNILINSYGFDGDTKTMMKWFDAMRADFKRPNEITYHAMLSAFRATKNEDGLELLAQLKAEKVFTQSYL